MKKLLFILTTLITAASAFAQQGKDGAANISTANTVVNTVNTTLSANAAIGATSIVVSSTVGLSAGDLLFIVQTQGATVNAYTYQYGNPNDALPNDTSAGKITTNGYNAAGNNEFAEINSISGNIITLNCALSDSFRGSNNAADIKAQVVRVPRYSSLNLSGSGSITCNAWNGTIGGVIVIEVQGNTTLAAGTSINASAKGFRGGFPLRATGFGSTSTGHNYGTPGSNSGAHKGESIVGDTTQYKKQTAGNYNGGTAFWLSSPLATCKANVANGGGGGDAMNCGGGGGSNGGTISLWNGMGNPDAAYTAIWNLESTTPTNGTVRPTSSSGGGRGGYAFSANSSSTADPTANGPSAAGVWGGDNRHNDGGWGGIPLDYSTGKIFLGGGGGAGDGNDGHASGGGNGGGIIYLLSYGTVNGAGQIISDGGSPLPTSSFGAGSNGDDGAGGGGGGGAVIIKSVGTISLTAVTPISAQGGKGGDNNYGGINTTNCYGPGGGGGGGYVATSNVVTGTNINAGSNGSVTGAGNTSRIKSKFPPNGATSGGVGSTTTSIAPFYLTASNYTVCPSGPVSLSVTVNGTTPGGLAVSWYTVATGGTPVSNSNPYAITAPASAGTYTYYAGTCPGTYRLPVLVTVNSSSTPIISITTPTTTICSGTTITLTASGVTSYTWDANAANATTNTVSVSPINNTTYTLTGANTGACAGTNTASITINVSTPPTITVTPASYSICSGANDLLTASGTSTSYTWSSNAGSATTNTVLVTPATIGATTYSVTGSNGVCQSTQTISINVTATPTVSILPLSAYICNGSNTTFTASGASTYSWSTSATTNTVSVSPTSNTIYTVTGNNGSCADTKTVLVKVDNGITNTNFTSNTASCGQANGSYVLNAVTGGISPYQINFNGTGFSAISAFSYTVPSLTGNTYPVIIKDSLGCTYTTSVSIGNTSGITAVDTTITNATCSPANSGAISINSVTGGTAPYQTNINGGAFNSIASFPYSYTSLTAGTYTILVKDGSGCPHISLVTVGGASGATTPTITASSSTTFCKGDSITLTSSSTYYNVWSTGLTADTTKQLIVKDSGNYFVTVNKNGCTAVSNTITVHIKPLPVTQVASVTSICQNQVPKIIPISGPAGATITVVDNLGQPMSMPFTPTVSGIYFVKDVLNGCTSTTKITIHINTAPLTAPTVTSPITYCYGQKADTLTAGLTVSGSDLVWEDANHNTILTPPNPTPSTTILGATTYYVYQNIGLCPGPRDSITVIILNKPNANFNVTPSTTVSVGQSVSFAPVLTTTANTYYWHFDDPNSLQNTSTQPLSTHVYNTAEGYCPKLVVTNQLGCKDSTTICIDVLTNISMIIPNVFSPNGDGINEVFSVKATGFTSFACDIFDRWGLKLYTWNSVSGYWDGGKAVEGAYFYVIQATDVRGEDHKYNGFVQLVK